MMLLNLMQTLSPNHSEEIIFAFDMVTLFTFVRFSDMCQIVTDGLVAVLTLTAPLVSTIIMPTASLADDPPVPAVHWVLPLTLPRHSVEVIPFPMLLRKTAN